MRIIFLQIFVLLNINTFFAQNIRLSANKTDLLYEIGDTMLISVFSATTDTLQLKAIKDRFSTPIYQNDTFRVAANSTRILKLKTPQQPCFLLLKAENTTENTTLGIGISIEKIRPLEPLLPDYDAFWAAEKAKQSLLPFDIQIQKIDSLTSDYSETFAFNLQAIANTRSYGYLTIPKTTGKKPCIVTLPPFGGGKNLCQPEILIAEWTGAISMSLTIHDTPPTENDTHDYNPNDVTRREGFYYKNCFLRLIRAIDYLYTRPDFDGENLWLTGVSQGAGLAVVLAGIEAKRVKSIVASNPPFGELAGLEYGEAGGFPNYLGIFKGFTPNQKAQTDLIVAGSYYDGLQAAQRFKGNALMVTSFKDDVCPPATTTAVYNLLEGQKQWVHALDLAHAHPNEYFSGRFDFWRRYLPDSVKVPNPFIPKTKGYAIVAGADMRSTSQNIYLTGKLLKENKVVNDLPLQWVKISGEGSVNFGNAQNANTSATFSKKGTYVLQLSATDSSRLGSDARKLVYADWIKVVIE